jgi:hypothetical protein
MSLEHVRTPLTVIYASNSSQHFKRRRKSRWDGGMECRTFESEDGNFAVGRGAGEYGAELMGSP